MKIIDRTVGAGIFFTAFSGVMVLSLILVLGNIFKELLDILACPKCKAPVRQEDDAIQCTNPACRLRYPVRNGIPVMLIDEAVEAK